MGIDNIRELAGFRAYCLAKPGATEGFPFGPGALVFKVKGKMFALCGVDSQPLAVNLKCEPDLAVLLRSRYSAVKPGYHMNKRHWNTVVLEDELPPELVTELIDISYELVVEGLKKVDREALSRR